MIIKRFTILILLFLSFLKGLHKAYLFKLTYGLLRRRFIASRKRTNPIDNDSSRLNRHSLVDC